MAGYGTRLRDLRTERGLSLRDVHERGGPHKDTLSLAEREEHKPNALTLAKIARAFGMTVSELRAELDEAETAVPLAIATEVDAELRTLPAEELRILYLGSLGQWVDDPQSTIRATQRARQFATVYGITREQLRDRIARIAPVLVREMGAKLREAAATAETDARRGSGVA